MNRLRVLLISHTYFPPDYRGKIRSLAARRDIELHLVAIPWMRTATEKLEYEHSDADTYPQHLVTGLFQSHNILRLYWPLTLVRLLRRFRPHIVHVEVEPHALALSQVLLTRSVSRYRVLFFTWENIFRPPAPPLRWVEHLNLRLADAAFAGNREAAQVLRRRGFGGPIAVMPQVGIDAGHCAEAEPMPKWAALRRHGPVVGFAGRLVAEKGVADLLEAFARLPDTLNAQLLFVGAGVLRDELSARARQFGLNQRVHFAGGVPFRNMPSYLKCMDVMILPSRTTPKWKEQFGHVLVEAMASGVPVVGSNSGAIMDVIGDAGLIYPEGDTSALCEHLSCLLAEPERRQSLSRKGIQRVAAHYTDEVVAEKTYQLYRQLCP
jgi:glycosyltransferase involved in cell wall biosynthesis